MAEFICPRCDRVYATRHDCFCGEPRENLMEVLPYQGSVYEAAGSLLEACKAALAALPEGSAPWRLCRDAVARAEARDP